MPRRPFVAGNWKMNKTSSEAHQYVTEFVGLVNEITSVDIVLCPPYTSLARLNEDLADENVKLGAQDAFWEDSGAFTSCISAGMLSAEKIPYCIVGHSERRGRFGKLEIPETTVGYFGETDESVNLKLKALARAGITAILCVGETLAEREAGNTDSVIENQLNAALDGLGDDALKSLIIAYEPVWAIGTGKTCDTPEAERVCGFIRQVLADATSPHLAMGCRILYGGSVKPSNAQDLFSQENIDGGLVGGASLIATDFAEIVKAAV
ncbi:MAG: triose-phosphate isomerase [Armatimonadetes bacterium]|nr:triose-phosphate isomerase [Armatimonadota bacterium]